MNGIFLETERLLLRKITREDFYALCESLQDIEVMYAWEYAFSDKQVLDWIARMNRLYEEYGYAYFAAVEKESGRIIGQIGLLPENVNGEKCVGVGYILNKRNWHQGYASEGARALLVYASECLHIDKVIADIRPCNTASRRVAESLGMLVAGEIIKQVDGKEMVHLLYETSCAGK